MTNVNKNRKFQKISHEKSMSFSDFRRGNHIFTQPLTKNRAVQNINCKKSLYFSNESQKKPEYCQFLEL